MNWNNFGEFYLHLSNKRANISKFRESLEEEIAGKSDSLRQMSREQADLQQWKSRFEAEGLVADEDVDELRRKQLVTVYRMSNMHITYYHFRRI